MVRPRCVDCKKTVTARQDALQCDTCNDWQHRLCNTGISRELYQQLSSGEEDINFYCSACGFPADESSVPREPDFESTRISSQQDQSADNDLPDQSADNNIADQSADNDLPDQSADSNIADQSADNLNNSSFTISDDEGSIINLDRTFDITRHPIAEPDIITETSIQDDSLPDELPEPDTTPTYSIVDSASQRGKRKLVDVNGYTYTVKKQKGESTTWWCSVRNKTTKCSATVLQKADNFAPGRFPHCHTADPGTLTSVKITVQAKSQAKQDVFRPTGEIVETAVRQHSDPTQPAGSRIKQTNLQRTVNRVKQKLRPAEPNTLDFEIDTDFIPARFMQKDITVDTHRHILFSTPDQLRVLQRAKRWFIDGTFKIVKEPFTQLLSVHAFITANNNTKMVPLAFALMSRRRKIDYLPVFQALRELLPQISVCGFVADFEAGVWQALREVFPGKIINGCLFHFTQAVFRHVQELGLQPAYRQQDSVFKYVRKLMALPFLPAEHIPPAFNKLREMETEPLRPLVQYVNDTWIRSTVWPIQSWTVYMQPTRTNNDVEGWHRRINKRSSDETKPFYLLVPKLFDEAALLPTQMKMVTESKLTRQQRLSTKLVQRKFFDLWDQYSSGDLSASQLLRCCGLLNGPSV